MRRGGRRLRLSAQPIAQNPQIGIHVVLNTDFTAAIAADLSAHGTILNNYQDIDALTMRVSKGQLAAIQAKPYVAAANPDAERNGAPVDTIDATDFGTGIDTWDLEP